MCRGRIVQCCDQNVNIRNIQKQNSGGHPPQPSMEFKEEFRNQLATDHVHLGLALKVESEPGMDIKNNCLKQCFSGQAAVGHEEGSYECRLCGKAFATETRLKRHTDTVHSSERRFFCDICRTGFTRHEHLKRHVLCHYNERPFQCEVCHKAFARREYLTRHSYIHSGETPIACPLCDRKFYRKDHLVKHQNRIHKKQSLEPG